MKITMVATNNGSFIGGCEGMLIKRPIGEMAMKMSDNRIALIERFFTSQLIQITFYSRNNRIRPNFTLSK